MSKDDIQGNEMHVKYAEDVNPMLIDENTQSPQHQVGNRINDLSPITATEIRKSGRAPLLTGLTSSSQDYSSPMTGLTGRPSDLNNSSLAIRMAQRNAGSTLSQQLKDSNFNESPAIRLQKQQYEHEINKKIQEKFQEIFNTQNG